MIKYLFVLFLLFTNFTIGQNSNNRPPCVVEPTAQDQTFNFTATPPSIIDTMRIIRVNIHFVLRTNGTGNFTETNDDLGNPLSGYKFAKDVAAAMNGSQGYNIAQNIFAGNQVPVLNKNYSFALDGVYFIRNDARYNFYVNNGGNIGGAYPTIGRNVDSVMNIFFTYGGTTVSGYVDNLNQFGSRKFTEIQHVYQRYKKYLDTIAINPSRDKYEWVMHAAHATINHELGHALGLSHTVLWNCENVGCPTADSGFVTRCGRPICGDDCDDTPSAPFMVDTFQTAQPKVHPHGRWASWDSPNRSNNLMDYSGANALSPCQITKVHAGLSAGLASFTVCKAVLQPTTICNIGFPKTSYYGSQVTIGGNACRAISEELSGEEYATVYFSDAVDFYPFEVRDTATFEVIYHKPCP